MFDREVSHFLGLAYILLMGERDSVCARIDSRSQSTRRDYKKYTPFHNPPLRAVGGHMSRRGFAIARHILSVYTLQSRTRLLQVQNVIQFTKNL